MVSTKLALAALLSGDNLLVFASRRLSTMAMAVRVPNIEECFKSTISSDSSRKVILLDGGTGEELFRRGVPDDRKIWSATAVVHPQHHTTLRGVHQSFLKAGSRCVTTNSYGIVPGVGFSKQDITKYVDIAGRIAREAVKTHDPTGRADFVLGSLGPLVESYRPDLIKPHSEGVEYYSLICNALHSHVDAFLAETMSSVAEAQQALDAVKATCPIFPCMVSFTLGSQGRLRDEESPTAAIQKVMEHALKNDIKLLAVLFNCAEPESITMALQQIRGDKQIQSILVSSGVLLGAYANRLAAVDPNWTLAESEAAQPFREDLNEHDYWDRFVSQWVEKYGVQLIGGCCGITPEHIKYIATKLMEQDKLQL